MLRSFNVLPHEFHEYSSLFVSLEASLLCNSIKSEPSLELCRYEMEELSKFSSFLARCGHSIQSSKPVIRPPTWPLFSLALQYNSKVDQAYQLSTHSLIDVSNLVIFFTSLPFPFNSSSLNLNHERIRRWRTRQAGVICTGYWNFRREFQLFSSL